MSLLIHPERLRGVHPELVAFCNRAAAVMPWDVLVICGVRTDEEQRADYAKGRTVPGPGACAALPKGHTVTEAATGEDSSHGRGAGVDVAPCTRGVIDWGTASKFKALGELAESMGLTWGGRFRKVDMDHVEIKNWKALPYPPVKPT